MKLVELACTNFVNKLTVKLLKLRLRNLKLKHRIERIRHVFDLAAARAGRLTSTGGTTAGKLGGQVNGGSSLTPLSTKAQNL